MKKPEQAKEDVKIFLPETKTVASNAENPAFMVLFGEPKSGKSTIAAEIPGALVLDLRNEYQFITALKAQLHDEVELCNLLKELKHTTVKYNAIVIDNATWLYEFCKPLGLEKYKREKSGRLFDGDLNMIPFGGVYYYPRIAFMGVINSLMEHCKTLVLICHQKDLDPDHPQQKVTADMVGKLKLEVLGTADTVGRVFRRKNQCFIDFNGGDLVVAESRLPRLRGQEILISELIGDEVKVYWDKILKY